MSHICKLLLHSEFYKLVFGSWKKFEQLMAVETEAASLMVTEHPISNVSAHVGHSDAADAQQDRADDRGR